MATSPYIDQSDLDDDDAADNAHEEIENDRESGEISDEEAEEEHENVDNFVDEIGDEHSRRVGTPICMAGRLGGAETARRCQPKIEMSGSRPR
jgi:hypothetical protein